MEPIKTAIGSGVIVAAVIFFLWSFHTYNMTMYDLMMQTGTNVSPMNGILSVFGILVSMGGLVLGTVLITLGLKEEKSVR